MRREHGNVDAAGEAFWRFSLALYARTGVAEALLALQDRAGADVNLVLYGVWLGTSRGRVITPAELAAAQTAGAPVAAGVVAELRGLRRGLRGAADGDLQCLRRRIAALELAAERRVQLRLTASLLCTGSPAQDRGAAVAANLAATLGPEVTSAEAGVVCQALASLIRRAD